MLHSALLGFSSVADNLYTLNTNGITRRKSQCLLGYTLFAIRLMEIWHLNFHSEIVSERIFYICGPLQLKIFDYLTRLHKHCNSLQNGTFTDALR